ncbi:uncharacterized protein LOC115226989 [Octopus sinensis]|uniref:Uncharacterized protein LOC115226989 n=1 Tax=Octopus sinensis TaxID=2607531 RepID=A0A6P7TQ03_9MOLL|nr:uncharacterized protein LOC115226989 [Octopus sinensis]
MYIQLQFRFDDVTEANYETAVIIRNCLRNFIDIILKPLCTYIAIFIRFDIDFLSHLPKTTETNSVLLSLDVVSLYTNIPYDLRIKAIKYWVDKHREAIPNRFTVTFILDSVKLILENNTFFFNGKNYIQIKGMAMGTRFAPVYANSVMGYLEQKLHQEIEERCSTEFRTYIEKAWKRYLDDCFIIRTKSQNTVKEFKFLLNNLHPSIQFTNEMSSTKLPFLDIMVIKKNTTITTYIYYKQIQINTWILNRAIHRIQNVTSHTSWPEESVLLQKI